MNTISYMKSLMENQMTISNMQMAVLEMDKELMFHEHHAILKEDEESKDKFSSRLKQSIIKILNKIKELIIKAKNWIVSTFQKTRQAIIKKYKSMKRQADVEKNVSISMDIYKSMKNIEYASNGLISAMAFATHDLELWLGRINSNPKNEAELIQKLQSSMEDIKEKLSENRQKIDNAIVNVETSYSSNELGKIDEAFDSFEKHSENISKSYSDHLDKIKSHRDKIYSMKTDNYQMQFKLSSTTFGVLTAIMSNMNSLSGVEFELGMTLSTLKAKLR